MFKNTKDDVNRQREEISKHYFLIELFLLLELLLLLL